MATQGKVYFAIAVHGLHLIKIGWSADTKQRLPQLQTSAPFPLEIIAEFTGTRKLESFFHQLYADCCEHGEWFRVEGDLLKMLISDRSHFVVDAAFYWLLDVASRLEREAVSA